jgi:hypothetical protein
MKKVYVLESPETYQAYSDELSQLLDKAIKEKNHKAGNAILKAIRALIHHMRMSLQTKYGRIRARHSMGAFQLPSWRDKTPQEILDEFYPLMSFYEHWEEKLTVRVPREMGNQKRATQKELRSLRGYLRALVRKARRMIIKRAPGWWTGAREREFEKYLPKGDL